MAYQKLQAGTALLVIPADNINIPNASNRVATGTTDGTNGECPCVYRGTEYGLCCASICSPNHCWTAIIGT